MAILLQISQIGAPILRQKAKPIKTVSKKYKDLINDLIETVEDANGVGIAAPQVYQPYRIFILASHPSKNYPDAPEMLPTPIINPEIISHDETVIKNWEGCLSIPGLRGIVPRYNALRVKYTDINGNKVETEFKGFISRIFQHEFDHLEGILFLDRMESMKDLVSEKEYQKMMAEKEKETKKIMVIPTLVK